MAGRRVSSAIMYGKDAKEAAGKLSPDLSKAFKVYRVERYPSMDRSDGTKAWRVVAIEKMSSVRGRRFSRR